MTQYDDIVITPVYGPLSTNQYPPVSGYHFIGILNGKSPTPQQFYPSQEPPNACQNTNARHEYARTAISNQTAARQLIFGKQSPAHASFSYSTGRHFATSSHVNYIAPVPSSMYSAARRRVAVGKSGFKIGLPNEAFYTTKNYCPSSTRSSLQRARSGGCVAPAKKGSIYNTSLTNGQVCAWGSIPRSSY